MTQPNQNPVKQVLGDASKYVRKNVLRPLIEMNAHPEIVIKVASWADATEHLGYMSPSDHYRGLDNPRAERLYQQFCEAFAPQIYRLLLELEEVGAEIEDMMPAIRALLSLASRNPGDDNDDGGSNNSPPPNPQNVMHQIVTEALAKAAREGRLPPGSAGMIEVSFRRKPD